MCPSGQQMQSNSHGPMSPVTFWVKARCWLKMWKTGRVYEECQAHVGTRAQELKHKGLEKNAKIFLTALEVKRYKSLFSDIPTNMWTVTSPLAEAGAGH